MRYDEDGRLAETTSTTSREPEYDELDRALIDAVKNYREDLHSCGRPLSESLHDVSRPNSEQVQYAVATQVCRACQALDKRHAQRHKDDTALIEAGRNPESWRLDSVMTTHEAEALIAAGDAAESD